jgi:hypothetical protein
MTHRMNGIRNQFCNRVNEFIAINNYKQLKIRNVKRNYIENQWCMNSIWSHWSIHAVRQLRRRSYSSNDSDSAAEEKKLEELFSLLLLVWLCQ